MSIRTLNDRTYRRLATLSSLLAMLVLAIIQSAQVVAEPPVAAAAEDDTLPHGAILRLGSNRFRQEGECRVLRYSHDGKLLASISDGAINIWDANSGWQIRQLRCGDELKHARHFSSFAFSPDGEEIAAVESTRVHIWELESGLELLSFQVDSEIEMMESGDLSYSPDGKQLAICGGIAVNLYDTTTGTQIRQLAIKDHRSVFYGTCWTEDGSQLSAATLEPAVVTWDTESGELVRTFKVEKKRGFSWTPTLSEDGKTLLASTGGIVHLWQYENGRHIKDIETDGDHIHTLVLTPDNKTLIVGNQDGSIRIIEVETGRTQRKIDGRLWIGRSIAVSPDFKTVALGAVHPTIRQWDIETGEEKFSEWTSKGHDAEVSCVAYSPDGRLIASGGANKQINLWDASTGKLLVRLPEKSSADHIAFTPSGQQLLTSWTNSKLIRIWDVAAGNQLRTIDAGLKRVRAFTLTPDGKNVIVIASDSKSRWHSPVGEEVLQIWDLESSEKRHDLEFKTASTESIALSPDGKIVVTGSANGVIHVMDAETGHELMTLPGHEHTADSLAFSPDGALLASGSTDQTIRLWDTKSRKPLLVLKGHKRAVTSIAFSPDGRMLASGSGINSYPRSPENAPKIRFWDVETAEQIGGLSGHDANTAAIAFAPDGQRLVSGHDNTTLLIWDVGPIGK